MSLLCLATHSCVKNQATVAIRFLFELWCLDDKNCFKLTGNFHPLGCANVVIFYGFHSSFRRPVLSVSKKLHVKCKYVNRAVARNNL